MSKAICTCEACGKLCFLTRKDARSHMKSRQRFKKGTFSVYACGPYYHFGHIPTQVKRGMVDRRNWVDPRSLDEGLEAPLPSS